MTAFVGIVACVLILLVSLVSHEAGHVWALRTLGGRIREAGIGIPLWPKLTLEPRGRRTFDLVLSPWPLGAYVIPDGDSEDMLKTRRYVDQAWFAGAGVVANLLTAGVVLVVYAATQGNWARAGVVAAVTVVLWFGRRWFCAAIPVLGIAALGLFILGLVASFTNEQGAGPIALFASFGTFADDLWVFAFGLPLTLGILNMLPIYPLDGGRVMDYALTKIKPSIAPLYRVVTGFVMAALFVYLLVTDLIFLS